MGFGVGVCKMPTRLRRLRLAAKRRGPMKRSDEEVRWLSDGHLVLIVEGMIASENLQVSHVEPSHA